MCSVLVADLRLFAMISAEKNVQLTETLECKTKQNKTKIKERNQRGQALCYFDLHVKRGRKNRVLLTACLSGQ